MTDMMAQMLDELMGKNRNLEPDKQKKFGFDDPSVCKHFLCGFCPNELFTNTKVDMGICRKIHDEKYREQYRNDPKFGKLGYEDDFEAVLGRMQNEMARKIRKNNERLELTQPEGEANNIRKDRTIIKINELEKKINDCLMKAEQMGAAGNVLEAEEFQKQANLHVAEKASAEKVLSAILNEEGAGPNGKSMEVCQICGCFLITGDAQVRWVDEHLLGKLHAGFAKIKVTLEEIEAQREAKRKERDAERDKRRGSRDKSRDKDRGDRDKDRGRDRDRRGSDRDRKEGSRSRPDRVDRDRRTSRDDRDRNRSSTSTVNRSSRDVKPDRDRSERDRDRGGDRDRRSSRGGTGTGGSSSSRRDRDAGGKSDRDRERKRSSRDRSPRERNGDSKRSRKESSSKSSSSRRPRESSKSPSREAAVTTVPTTTTEEEGGRPRSDSEQPARDSSKSPSQLAEMKNNTEAPTSEPEEGETNGDLPESD